MKTTPKNTLHVYDFDDTLVSTTSFVYIKNKKTNTSKKIPAHKFYEYPLTQDEEFDMAEFETMPDPKLLPLFQEFVTDIKTLGKQNVAILTARHNPRPVKKFLRSVGVSGVEIKAVGLSDPSPGDRDVAAYKKKDWLKQQIINRNLQFLLFFDDNEKNIYAAKELEAEFPNVKFLIELV